MIDNKTVTHIAALAHIAVAEDELPVYAKDIGAILAMVEGMNAVNTADVEPVVHPTDCVQQLRDDAVTENDVKAALQQSAPKAVHGYYVVPKVIE